MRNNKAKWPRRKGKTRKQTNTKGDNDTLIQKVIMTPKCRFHTQATKFK